MGDAAIEPGKNPLSPAHAGLRLINDRNPTFRPDGLHVGLYAVARLRGLVKGSSYVDCALKNYPATDLHDSCNGYPPRIQFQNISEKFNH